MITKIIKKIKYYCTCVIKIFQKDNNIHSKYAYNRFREEELESSYTYFKKYFYNSIFLKKNDLRKYAIKKALDNDVNEENLFLEFGVYKGESTNFFSTFLKKKLHAFDSFEGLEEDWLGFHHAAGDFGGIEIPKLNKNVNLVIGRIQDTLPDFLIKNKNFKISFIHIDVDNYSAAKFILQNIKTFLSDGAIICFDEFYNYQGWKNGEFKALTETFKDDEFSYRCFADDGEQVVIQYDKKTNI